MDCQRILFAADFSEASHAAFEPAAFLARLYGGKVDVVHVLSQGRDDPAEARQLLERSVPPEHLDVVGERRLVRALKPELGLVHEAREGDYDLLVLGTHGRSGFRHVLLGSVAERVVQLASCPVLTVRRPGAAFEHP